VTALLIALGTVLVLVAIADAVQTTLSAGSGGGPLTARLGRVSWRGLLRLGGGQSSRLLGYGGMLVLLLTVAVWVLLLWAGWALIFLASPGAIVDATTGAAASVPATIYYAGFVVFTLGVGDFVSTSGAWQVLTAVASFIGLFLITLSITYLVSVVSAGVTSRQFAESVSILGRNGPEIVLAHWTGGQISSQFASQVQTLSTQLLKITQQHLAYPILHYFHSTDPASSAPRAVASLDDALVLLDCAVHPDVAPGSDVLGPGLRALERYAQRVHATGGRHAGTAPLPALQPLRDAGVPVRPQSEYEAAVTQHRSRREQLSKVVASDARPWPS
jgi:hypothetical protein